MTMRRTMMSVPSDEEEDEEEELELKNLIFTDTVV